MTEQYYIWSMEHRAYWKDDRAGYTTNRYDAGVYDKKEAYEILRESNIVARHRAEAAPEEALIPVETIRP